MARDPRYDILFEPVQIGPVTAKNRFYQVPHCSGMGYRYPSAEAAMRGVKAEGGWAVVSTQECEIHETTDVSPYAEARLWDDRDIPALARMVDAVHAHGALAAIQLVYQGHEVSNRYSREPPIGPMHRPVAVYDPFQARAMDKSDIREFRRWHRDAALRAKRAGFDLVYVYAGHDLTMPMHFLCRRYNQRRDEYGGSLENRVRLLRELLEDTKEAVGDTCAVPLRMAVDELRGEDGLTAEGEGREIVEMLAELPDLWDVNVSNWPNDSLTSRFGAEGFQETYVNFVKQVTSKPVVGVGRFTSPDAMVSQIKRGVLDLIGAARPSIADPFLPKKIEEGRPEDIRECIGCNICASGERTNVPMRCTQNPTMGEEWRKGWHPEVIAPKGSDDQVLIVGAGPAGLECARALGRRGYGVILAEAEEELGGRVAAECRLPGLAAWGRVRDYRLQQLHLMPNVELYPASRLSAEHVLEFGFPRVVLATGCHWRKDGLGRQHHRPIPGSEQDHVVAPESVMAGDGLTGPIVIYDDDHFYLGGVLAEKLRAEGHEVAIVTPALQVSIWTDNTLEQGHIQRRLLDLGVEIVTQRRLEAIGAGEVELSCLMTGRRETRPAGGVVLLTGRLPEEALYQALMAEPEALGEAEIASVTRIGDCLAPATIAAAVYAGHRYARELDAPAEGGAPFARELAALDPDFGQEARP
jgi:dimethylamine/trimethylamine dehydrogenase